MPRNLSKHLFPWLIVFACAGLLWSVKTGSADEPTATPPLNFADHARQVFRTHCAACHNANKTQGDLDLTNYSALMQGGSSGDVIEPGSADDSYLFQLVTHEDSPRMPPGRPKIPSEDIEVIRKWINAGAIAKSGAAVVKLKKPSFAMSTLTVARPSEVVMPVDLPTESFAKSIRPPLASSMASSPWAPVVAVAAANQIVLYHADEAEKDRLLGVLPWGDGRPKIVRFSQDGTRLIAGGGRAAVSGHVAVWDVATGEQELKLGDELDSVIAADLSPDGRTIATGGPERIVRLYALDKDQPPTSLAEHTDWVTAVQFSPNGQYLVSGDRNGGVILRLAVTGEPLFRLPSHKAPVTSIAWRADSKVFASASESGKVAFWNSKDGSAIKSFDSHRGGCLSIAFTRDGKLLSGGRDKKVALWNLKGKRLKTYTGTSEIVTAVCVNGETETVFAGSFDGRLQSWNLHNAKPMGRLETNPAVTQ